MKEKTCAACDCKLDADVISVTLGGKTVDVCCEECAVLLKEAHVSATYKEGRAMAFSTASAKRSVHMKRFSAWLIIGLIALPAGTGALAASPEHIRIADGDSVVPLTIAGAKQRVAKVLSDNGEYLLRAGHAEFDHNGNVTVEVVTFQGIPLRHVVVEANSGRVVDARSHMPVEKKGG